MKIQLEQISGEEFIERILSGQRKFANIELPKGFDLFSNQRFGELQDYLKKQDLEKNRLRFLYCSFRHLRASGLYAPFLAIMNSDCEKANLDGAVLDNMHSFNTRFLDASMIEAYLRQATIMGSDSKTNKKPNNSCLICANLSNAKAQGIRIVRTLMHKAVLYETKFNNGTFEDVDFLAADVYHTDFTGATFIDVRNLETALHLKDAIGLPERYYQNAIMQ